MTGAHADDDAAADAADEAHVHADDEVETQIGTDAADPGAETDDAGADAADDDTDGEHALLGNDAPPTNRARISMPVRIRGAADDAADADAAEQRCGDERRPTRPGGERLTMAAKIRRNKNTNTI